MNSYFQFIISKHTFLQHKKMNIILASRHCQSLEFFCRLYSIRNHLHRCAHELEQKLFIQLLHGQKFRPCLCNCTKTGTVATSITLDSNSSSEKLSSSTSNSVIIATTQSLATCFEGVIPHELFS
jgi:hypothetical protein